MYSKDVLFKISNKICVVGNWEIFNLVWSLCFNDSVEECLREIVVAPSTLSRAIVRYLDYLKKRCVAFSPKVVLVIRTSFDI